MFSMPTHFFANLNKYVNIILPVGFNYVFVKFSIDDVSTNDRRRRKKTSVRASSTIVLINLALQTSLYIYSLYLITRIYS
jgi:hypothetical protein